jgi:hypothetical protein
MSIEKAQLQIDISPDSAPYSVCYHTDCFKDATARACTTREESRLHWCMDIMLCEDHFPLMVTALRQFGFKFKGKGKTNDVRIKRAPLSHEDWACEGCIITPAKWHISLTLPDVVIANVCSDCLTKLRERCAVQGMRIPEELLNEKQWTERI